MFAKAAHSSIRKVGVSVFNHVLSLDLSYHLERRTGAVGKAIDRGARAIQFILIALVFNLLPTMLEVGLVTGILVSFPPTKVRIFPLSKRLIVAVLGTAFTVSSVHHQFWTQDFAGRLAL